MKEFSRKDYVGSKSTLCTGCGHDSITNHLITSLFKSKINPYKVAKLSGIGCSSKTPNYFLSTSQGFNSLHGRMAPLATGVHLAQEELKIIGISGDGDTASIGLGSFAHLLRRNVPMIYVVENNGVYGLTKGQFSATADEGSTTHRGHVNKVGAIDICSLALEMGATFVARSFSGDAKQLTALFSLALRHKGTAVIDIVSPCITFANHEGSTKSYDAVRTRNKQLQELGFIQPQEEITLEDDGSTLIEVKLHDGSRLWLKKTAEGAHDITDRDAAAALLNETKRQGQLLTGLFYWDAESRGMRPEEPATALCRVDETSRPSRENFRKMLSQFA
jgi:2-oxoglutarate ferredoxin oxidoreductase subunit beta